MKSPYITRNGYERLRQELDHLLREKRPALTRAVSEAAALGDRSENAEYIYGKKLLRETDRRIRFLQQRLPQLSPIDRAPDDPQRVRFGAFVELEDETGNSVSVRLVGVDELDPERHWISIDAPLARALLGKQADDDIQVKRPDGKIDHYSVVSLHYAPEA